MGLGLISGLAGVDSFVSSGGEGSLVGEFFGSDRAIDNARSKEAAALEALEFEREMADILRGDAEPLRDIRNQSLDEVGEFLRGGESTFRDSVEFNTVKDAASQPAYSAGLPSGAKNALLGRAENIALGELQPFTNRIFNTAGITSQGLNNTNSLLQQNIDARAQILSNAGSNAAGGLLDSVAANQQSATGLLSLFGALCDERAKENKRLIRTDSDGLNVYEFNYIGQPEIYEGKMAQDIQRVDPDNVFMIDGYLRVADKYAPRRVA